MPLRTPQKPQAKARAVDPTGQIDWMALWAVSLGICAVMVAATAYFTIGDKLGAATILASVAGIIGRQHRELPLGDCEPDRPA